MELVLGFLKKYWLVFVIIGAVITYIHIRLGNAEEILKLTVDSYHTQITEVRDLHQKELEFRDKAIKDFENKVKSLEDDYKKKSDALDVERKRKIQVIVKYHAEPEKLASQIQERYGFIYVPVKKTNSNTR